MGGKLTFDSERKHQASFRANFARKLVQSELLVLISFLELLGKQKLGEVKSLTAVWRDGLVLLEVVIDIWARPVHLGVGTRAHARCFTLALFHYSFNYNTIFI